MRVEFLLAHEDGTWCTEVFDVPAIITSHKAQFHHPVVDWAYEELAPKPEYRKIIFWGLYDMNPDEGDPL